MGASLGLLYFLIPTRGSELLRESADSGEAVQVLATNAQSLFMSSSILTLADPA
jgi:hypothetical protein